MTDAQKAFIEEIAPLVQKHAPAYGIEVYSPIIAQAILESGWGQSKLAKNNHNYFGLKTGTKWTGPYVVLTTSEEYTPGTHTTIKAKFRSYSNMSEGVKGYFDFISLARYKNLKGVTDPREYLENIKKDGYATASNYVSELMEVIGKYGLTKYDKQEKKGDEYMAKFSKIDDAIDAVLAAAEAEEGYLEKKTNAQLDSKTANAGKNNFTKYWRDIKPAWNGQYWCACFVSWCFMVVFGQELAAKLLKHWPYVYCPTLAAKTDNKTPKRGSIIIFWKPNSGRYGHTGLVYKVDATYVYTIEGNTSGASGVISNGGGVVKKRYKRTELHAKTLYYMPDYSLAVSGKAEKQKTTTETAAAALIPGTCTVTLKTFLPGASDVQIKTIQRLLKELGYKGENGRDLVPDGVIGHQTQHAISEFQKAEKLDIKSPGTVGEKTWQALLNAK